MRKLLLSVFAILVAIQFSATLMAQGAPPQGGADQPYTGPNLECENARRLLNEKPTFSLKMPDCSVQTIRATPAKPEPGVSLLTSGSILSTLAWVLPTLATSLVASRFS
jgi:hypothetical protein